MQASPAAMNFLLAELGHLGVNLVIGNYLGLETGLASDLELSNLVLS